MEENVALDDNVTAEKEEMGTNSKRKAFVSKYFSTSKLATMGVFTALSFVLYMFVKFPLPTVFPFFLDFQFSDIPALIAAFIFGPVEALVIVTCKILLKLPFSSTAFVGELADFLMGIAFVVPAGLVYRKSKNKKGALIGLACGVLSTTIVAIIANRFILVPFFASFYGGMENVVKSLGKLYVGITEQTFYNYYLWLGVLPFNLIRGIISAMLTFFLYGYLEKALKHIFHKY